MKKILITTAVMLLTVFVSSQAKASITLVTTNGGSFNYDPANVLTDSFNVGSSVSDNGLNDFALYLGYRNTDNSFETPIELQTIATNGVNVGPANRGSINFAPVTFGNGVTVDALATFRLADTSATIGDPSASLLYDLELTTSGVAGNEGALLSLAGFDFNNNALSDRNQPNEIISGFGNSQVAIGDVNPPISRVLAGDFNFDSFQDAGRTIVADNTRDDEFNGTIASNLNSLTGFAPPSSVSSSGDLGFAAFADFGERDVDRTDITAGVVGFRSTLASNATIPEPSTLLMASMGLGMVAFRRRRKQA